MVQTIQSNQIRGSAITPALLQDTAVTPGTYGDTTHVSQLTVDADGRVTFAANVAIAFTSALATTNPVAVASVTTAGVGTAASKWDHAHVGLHSLATTGQTALVGDVTLTAGANALLTQSGQNITIASTGTVTSVSAGTGLTGGPVTTSGTLSGGTLLNDGVVCEWSTTTPSHFFAWPWGGTVTGWDLIADTTGTLNFDVKDAAYASFPGSAVTIFTTTPALSAVQKNTATGLGITVTKGHWAQSVITSATTATYCTLVLYISRT